MSVLSPIKFDNTPKLCYIIHVRKKFVLSSIALEALYDYS